jgi:hypothetical protein
MGDRRHVPGSGAVARRALYQAGRSGVQVARLYEFEVEYRDCGMAERSRPEACAGLNRNSSGGYNHFYDLPGETMSFPRDRASLT